MSNYRNTKLFKLIKTLYYSFNYTFTLKTNGKKLKGLKLYHSRSENSEKWMGQILDVLLRMTGGTFIDVGVNIGQTLCQVKSIDPKRNYIGFEPNSACNMFVYELIKKNNFQEVTIFPVGLHTKDSILTLDLYDDSITNSGGSVVDGYWEYRNIKPKRSLLVPLMTFETINQSYKINDVGIIKIDVEGAELEVLLTMEKTIDKFRPIIIIEILSAYSEDNVPRITRQKQIIDFIKKMNYRIYRILEDSDNQLDSFMSIDYFDPYFDKNQCNYLFIPFEKKPSIQENFSIKET